LRAADHGQHAAPPITSGAAVFFRGPARRAAPPAAGGLRTPLRTRSHSR